MSACPPDFRRHDDGGFEADDVVAAAGHGGPPEFLDVAFEFGAERAVVPESVYATVDFRRLKNKAAPFAQRHDFFHERILFGLGHKAFSLGYAHGDVKVGAEEVVGQFEFLFLLNRNYAIVGNGQKDQEAS